MQRVEELPFVAVRDLRKVDDRGLRHARAVRAGSEYRVRSGIYVDADRWEAATDDARYLLRMQAVAATRRGDELIFSHESAALLWGLPRLGRWPEEVHALSTRRRGATRANGVVWHRDAFSDDDVCEHQGYLVTTLKRTLLDLARTRPFASAVMALDHATKHEVEMSNGQLVHGIPLEELRAELEALGSARGTRAGRAAMRFTDNSSGSPGESLSRVQIHLLRFPRPRLQVPVPRNDAPGADFPDFEWDEHLGEFDGKVKYTRNRYMKGKPIEEIVWEEKVREDRLRAATGKRMVRWLWQHAHKPPLLRARLVESGLYPLTEAQYRREFGEIA